MSFNSFIDSIWPHLEGEPIQDNWVDINVSDISNTQEQVLEENIKILERLTAEETARLNKVESKGSVLLGIVGGVMALSTGILSRHTENRLSFILLFTYILCLIYFFAFIYYVSKTQKRIGLYKIIAKEVIERNFDKKKYYCYLVNNLQHNYNKINVKVDNMSLAQAFFMRVIFMLVISIMIELISESGLGIGSSSTYLKYIANYLGSVKIASSLIINSFICSLFAFIISIVCIINQFNKKEI
mgnify:CR=1 FL=1|jgi:hypothetical protein